MSFIKVDYNHVSLKSPIRYLSLLNAEAAYLAGCLLNFGIQ